ncbi:MAG TPA: hypothetical protein DCS93_16850 [Microscillaceae bacterium]|nr:hypothetical protein [Microscillaceae bacterium]
MNTSFCDYLFYKKLLLLIAFLSLPIMLAAQNPRALNLTIKLQQTSATIPEFLKELNHTYGFRFAYDESIMPNQRFKVYKNQWQLDKFLQKLLQQAKLKFEQVNNLIIVKKNNTLKTTLSGTITSKDDGEQLIGATVYVQELGIGTLSNTYGFYSITIPPGEYTFIFSYIGYKRFVKRLIIEERQLLNVALPTLISNLKEVVVKAKQEEEIESVEAVQMSAHSLEIAQIKSSPMLAGEADVLKSLQFLPGIQNGSEGTANFSVRGGGYDQNLVLLDDAPVYNISHSLGFFSVFNVDAIKDVRIYKGGIPAKYGGRLSSVVDIRMKEGNNQKLILNGSVGLVGSRLTVEGPLGKNVSYLISGRYGYLGHTGNFFAKNLDGILPGVDKFGKNNEISFYDLNAKINVQLNENNQIYFSAFAGNDHFYNEAAFENNTLDWGNQTGTFRWNHIYNSRLFSNFTLVYSNFDYSYTIQNELQNFKWSANQQQQSAKLDFDYFASPKHTLNFGLALSHNQFAPGKVEALNSSSSIKPLILDTQRALETGLYFSHKYQVTKKLSLNYGIRFSSFHRIGAGNQYTYDGNGQLQEEKIFDHNEIMTTYVGLEPRASARLLLNSSSSIKASYNRTYQYLHLVNSTTIGLPTDVWLPVDNNIKPRFADQVALGYFKKLHRGRYEISAEIYHKWINQVIDYKDNANIFLNKHIATQIRTGEGRAYGFELLFEKKKGKFKGWLSYTLSKVERTINGVNNDQTYSPRYDRRHNLSIITSYELSERWQISANYSYITGAGITVPQGLYDAGYGVPLQYFSSRNGFKLPDFHQLDIGIKLKSKKQKRWQGEWYFGVTNAYNRKNPIAYYLTGIVPDEQVSQLYLFGFMPSINYNFKF